MRYATLQDVAKTLDLTEDETLCLARAYYGHDHTRDMGVSKFFVLWVQNIQKSGYEAAFERLRGKKRKEKPAHKSPARGGVDNDEEADPNE